MQTTNDKTPDALKAQIVDIPESDKQQAEHVTKLFTAGVSYKQSRGLYDEWNEFERFWDADQWPAPNAQTKNFPRPVTNFFAEIIEQKVAALVYELPDVFFEPIEGDPERETEDEAAAKLLSDTARFQAHKMELDELLENFCRDAALLGTGIMYHPWDNSIVGGSRVKYVGDIAGYVIDPADIFPDDPTNPDMQTQPGWVLAERRPLDQVREYYRDGEHGVGGVVDLLEPEAQTSDTQVYDHQGVEHSETGYVDVLHRWWKAPAKDTDGKEVDPHKKVVWYVAVCQGYIVSKPRVLYRHGRYPFVGFRWYPKRKSFFGKPESKDILNNQKEANRMDGVMLLAAYFTALPEKRFNPDFVDERDLKAMDPGRAIKDTAPPGTSGVSYLQPPQMPAYPAQMRDRIVESTKSSAGVHEAWTGKAPGADLNASAIIALQEAAGVRIRGIQRRFHRAVRDMARLWLAHWCEFAQENRLVRLVRITGTDNALGFAWFRGTDFADKEFDVLAQANASSPYSRSLQVAQLDKMLMSQIITPEEYLWLLPPEVFPQLQQLLDRRQSGQEDAWRMQIVAEVIQEIAGRLGVPPDALAAELGIPPELLAAAEAAKQEQGGGGAPPQSRVASGPGSSGVPPDAGPERALT